MTAPAYSPRLSSLQQPKKREVLLHLSREKKLLDCQERIFAKSAKGWATRPESSGDCTLHRGQQQQGEQSDQHRSQKQRGQEAIGSPASGSPPESAQCKDQHGGYNERCCAGGQVRLLRRPRHTASKNDKRREDGQRRKTQPNEEFPLAVVRFRVHATIVAMRLLLQPSQGKSQDPETFPQGKIKPHSRWSREWGTQVCGRLVLRLY